MAKRIKSFSSEFRGFLKEYKIVGLAMAFMVGLAAQNLVQSLVNDIFMPFINPLVPDNWQTASLSLGQVEILWGPLLSNVINFIIIALFIFLMAKWVLKEEKVSKK